jgi:hypothetical protein
MGEFDNEYVDDIVSIHGETFDTDFDEVGFEPEVIDDSDDDAANMFDY